jgi:hypothetical protein
MYIPLLKMLLKKRGYMLSETEETRKEHSEGYGSQELMLPPD